MVVCSLSDGATGRPHVSAVFCPCQALVFCVCQLCSVKDTFLFFFSLPPGPGSPPVAPTPHQYQADHLVRPANRVSLTSIAYVPTLELNLLPISSAYIVLRLVYGLAERTWHTISAMSRSMLVHARLPDTFMYHALAYATHVFNILPVRGLTDTQEVPSTPHQLFFEYL
jgi:hypothetical protein